MCALSGERRRSSRNCQSWIGPRPAGTGEGRGGEGELTVLYITNTNCHSCSSLTTILGVRLLASEMDTCAREAVFNERAAAIGHNGTTQRHTHHRIPSTTTLPHAANQRTGLVAWCDITIHNIHVPSLLRLRPDYQAPSWPPHTWSSPDTKEAHN